MNTTSQPGADQARAALQQAQDAELTTAHDRLVHGLATAGFGLLMGVFVVVSALTRTNPWATIAFTAAYVAILLGLAAWQKRAARTVPRNSRIIGIVGVTISAVLTLGSIIWLNVRQGGNRIAGVPDQIDTWWAYTLTVLVVALPMLIAAALIIRRPHAHR